MDFIVRPIFKANSAIHQAIGGFAGGRCSETVQAGRFHFLLDRNDSRQRWKTVNQATSCKLLFTETYVSRLWCDLIYHPCEAQRKQESISIGCVLPAYTNRTCFNSFNSHQVLAPLVGFSEWTSLKSDVHQMSLVWGFSNFTMSRRGTQGNPLTLNSNASWVMVTWDSLLWTEWLTDGQARMKTLPSHNFFGKDEL